jgi:hypothetical protein
MDFIITIILSVLKEVYGHILKSDLDWELYTLKDGMGFKYFIPMYNSFRLILQEPSNQ